MIALRIGVTVAALAAAQAELQLDPDLVMQKQQAAKALDADAVKKFAAIMRELAAAAPKVQAAGDEEAQDRAQEQATRVACAKVGLPVERFGPMALLVTEWFMVQAPAGAPKDAAARKAGFVGRYGQRTADLLTRHEAEIRAAYALHMR